ncbi:MAG: UDP-N-acetylglucosamine 2-epimerase [Tepidisphaerales bacterium]
MGDARHITFVTGTRADLGLMRHTLRRLCRARSLSLSVVATGMHLDRRYGPPLSAVREVLGREPDAVVPWPRTSSVADLAAVAGAAAGRLARTYAALGTRGVLLVGDRPEALAAAMAAHLSRIPIAHVHGGDRAEGQTDDAIRHAITHMSQLHLAASADAAARLVRLGQDPRTVHHVGAPGLEDIARDAAKGLAEAKARFGDLSDPRRVVLLLHPTSPDRSLERRRARHLLWALARAELTRPLVLAPNNDPGHEGIREAYGDAGLKVVGDLPRGVFLGLLKGVGLLVGNSSAGVIEAPSLGVSVVDVGDRQSGRVRGPAVRQVGWAAGERGLAAVVSEAARWRGRAPSDNPYAPPPGKPGGPGGATSARIVRLLRARCMVYPACPKRLTH